MSASALFRIAVSDGTRKTPQGLKLGGLHEFGYTDLEYVPYSKPYYDPKTVMEEFRP